MSEALNSIALKQLQIILVCQCFSPSAPTQIFSPEEFIIFLCESERSLSPSVGEKSTKKAFCLKTLGFHVIFAARNRGLQNVICEQKFFQQPFLMRRRKDLMSW